ncbi:hypothetical protein [Kribbella sp. NPDC051620]|uniref:hypothetical protein n=1 Tax=Kribbella sp. NPDC051620 TaxID=3364120 RepID=UPI0037AA9E34
MEYDNLDTVGIHGSETGIGPIVEQARLLSEGTAVPELLSVVEIADRDDFEPQPGTLPITKVGTVVRSDSQVGIHVLSPQTPDLWSGLLVDELERTEQGPVDVDDHDLGPL